MLKIIETEPLSETIDEYVDTIVGRAVAAQKEFQTWSEEATDTLLQALARCVYTHAEELAIAAVLETGMGNVRDKTIKNRFASMGIYGSLEGHIGQGRLAVDRQRRVMTLASPVGVVFGLMPAIGIKLRAAANLSPPTKVEPCWDG